MSFGDAPIFEPEFDIEETYPNGDKLPGLFISRPLEDEDGKPCGRTRVMLYPFSGYPDHDGHDALYYGGGYYEEGMSYAHAEDHEKRIDCFRAAELLYRHSAGRGCSYANLCLGYVYSYDRCEGQYWVDPMTLETAEDYERPYPRKERAFECFKLAAEADIAEGCYKLGDLYKHGTGCDADAASAFKWYARAAEVSDNERPAILGSIALRLGECHEEGFGCEQDFGRALEWYRRAVDGLEAAVKTGESWYTKALASARNGVKRCLQEKC